MDKPDLYDPQINRSYAELAAHYGALVDPARAFKPKEYPEESVIPSPCRRERPRGLIDNSSSG